VSGQERATALLLRAKVNGRLASAYLFEGPEGCGKERCARALAQATVCTEPRDDGDACGACSSCRAVASESHVDVITLARELDVASQQRHRSDDIKSELTVEKVRLLQSERLTYRSHQGVRWVVVRDAHLMNVSASNALLKTLEEPPTDTHFALVTSRPARLLSTIRSRCQRVRFAPLSDAIVRDLLVRLGDDASIAAEASQLADGSMARARELCDPELLARRKGLRQRFLDALRAGRSSGYVDVAESFKDLAKGDRAEVDAVLELLERHFHDEAVTHAPDAGRRAAANAARADVVRRAVDSLDRNLNVPMAIEHLFLRLRETRG